MDLKPLLYTSLMLMMPLLAGADTVQIVQGTPGTNSSLPVTGPSPSFQNVINFANLGSQITNPNCSNAGTNCPAFNSAQYASSGVTNISSPDGLLIYPFSDQTAGGIELFDPGATDPSTCVSTGTCDGTADITINLAYGVEDLAAVINLESGHVEGQIQMVAGQKLGIGPRRTEQTIGGADIGQGQLVRLPGTQARGNHQGNRCPHGRNTFG